MRFCATIIRAIDYVFGSLLFAWAGHEGTGVFFGWLAGWLLACLLACLLGWLVGWLVGWSASWAAASPACPASPASLGELAVIC